MAILKKLKSADEPAEDRIAIIDRDLAELNGRLGEFDARIRALNKQILDREASAASRVISSADAQAQALLDGKLFDARSQFPLSELTVLQTERSTLHRATNLGVRKRALLMEERAELVTVQFQAEITQVERQRVTAALALQRVNREREA